MDLKLVNVRRSVNTFYSSYPQRPPASSIFYNKQKIEQNSLWLPSTPEVIIINRIKDHGECVFCHTELSVSSMLHKTQRCGPCEKEPLLGIEEIRYHPLRELGNTENLYGQHHEQRPFRT